jgi:heme-degrading monooxygenase HmoA
MIVCLRHVGVPPSQRARYLNWIGVNREVRDEHGILFEWILEPADGETVVATGWPSEEVFEAWIRTPERERLTPSDVHQAVAYRPLTRYQLVGGYTSSRLARAAVA